tara:strand:+ start:13 stop:1989 length:1977 start_codon:yes stop_codon:yes gene_type:complete
MDPTSLKVLLSGSKKDDPLYVDDVFSNYLYEGTGSAQTISNGIDLAGEGGLVWFKNRDNVSDHSLVDTERGAGKEIGSNSTRAERNTSSNHVQSFTSSGFTLGTNWVGENAANTKIVSWTFRKAPGFFDVVTYTGDSNNSQQISHSLGSTPGMVIVKSLSTDHWNVWHTSGGYDGIEHKAGLLNSDTDFNYYGRFSNALNQSSLFTDSLFTVQGDANTNGTSFVAYVFANDDARFGTNQDESIIKCGSYTTTGNGSPVTVDLGFEPQFLFIKSTAANRDWHLFDTMRGITPGNDLPLYSNNNYNEAGLGNGNFLNLTSTGFTAIGGEINWYNAQETVVYMAIRRPHKPPTNGTEVFNTSLWVGTGSRVTTSTGFPVDLSFSNARDIPGDYLAITDRVRGSGQEFYGKGITKSTNVGAAGVQFDLSTGLEMQTYRSVNGKNYFSWNFKRAPGFFDIVPYDGTGSTTPHQHGLGVVPELMLVKCTTNDEDWAVYAAPTGPTKAFTLNTTSEAITSSLFWNNTAPTASGFTVGNYDDTNASGRSYINYLFATLPGISKVGSYNGTGSNIDVDCGFTAGARFVLIKCVEYIFNPSIATGWFVWDSARGINSGNEPWIFVNESTGEVTSNDYIDPINSGFRVTSSGPPALNASGYSYIFLAIA